MAVFKHKATRPPRGSPFQFWIVDLLQSANNVMIPLEPCVQVGGAKTPELANMRAANLATPRQLLQRLMVNLQQVRGLLAIEKRLEFCHGEPAASFSDGGNCGEGMCHISLLFPHNGQLFHKSPRLIQDNLITTEHQRGSIESSQEYLGAKDNPTFQV